MHKYILIGPFNLHFHMPFLLIAATLIRVFDFLFLSPINLAIVNHFFFVRRSPRIFIDLCKK